jgi:hypothetical protein
METCVANLLEPGEKVVVGNNGIWGSRVVDMAGRYNGEDSAVVTCRALRRCLPGCRRAAGHADMLYLDWQRTSSTWRRREAVASRMMS